ncbi:DUF4417 domain-containing protein [Gemella sp. zg-570]|uniref:DUF4417 domain-containing protein n=1 Tax=Gemella sp. zg-570 TaxID=2840371 RepID=UPI001C0E24E8|nr:DUF4417 domain-containing protein [Gemella sp. zg-570]QWQ38513.1 DUF4417 domain-containing protein [Gemella sp. zg-570]
MIIIAKTVVDDGFVAYLVNGAEFHGRWEIPIIKKDLIEIPKDIVPFDKVKKISEEDRKKVFVHFYMHDLTFRRILSDIDKYFHLLSDFGGIISPDFSLYIDMSLCLQLTNVYLNRAVGYYFQSKGIKVIPNVRWGDERTFEFAFLGLEKESVYAISTVACIRSLEEKNRFKKGLKEMIKRLKPKQIIVNGTRPEYVFKDFYKDVEFINFECWTSRMKQGKVNGNK